MCIVCKWNSGEKKLELNIKELNCKWCTRITSIPQLPELEYLYCTGCTNLISIPMMPKLKELFCNSCTALTSIPALPKLKELYCRGCTSLTSISQLPSLTHLYCSDCTSLTSISIPEGLEGFNYENCKWIKEVDVLGKNIKALRTCQAIVKRKLTARKLERLIPELVAIYYSPGCKGEALALHAFSKNAVLSQNIIN